MAEQFGEKQHEATQHRRQQARAAGQVARSHDLASALLLLAAVAALMYFGRGLASFLIHVTGKQLGSPSRLDADEALLLSQGNELLYGLAKATVPILGTVLVVAVLAHVVQVGFLFVPGKLAFDVSRVSPLKGIQRLLSISSAARLGLGIVKVIVVVAVAAWSLWAERGDILGLAEMGPLPITEFVCRITTWTCLKIGAALLMLAIVDYWFQWWKHERDLRMTTQELREEMKSLQGDPQLVARRRAIQRQLVLDRVTRVVPEADVVIAGRSGVALALQYDEATMAAPLVIAKGSGTLAARIRRIAGEHQVPTIDREQLAETLFKSVDVGQPVPPDRYASVADVLRHAYRLQRRERVSAVLPA